MPTSKLDCWPAILRLVAECAPRRVLDIGPGHGKAGLLVREYVGTLADGTGPIESIDCLESEQRYLDRSVWMPSLYDTIRFGRVEDEPADRLAAYDVVLLVEVLQCLTEEAVKTLMLRIPCPIIVCTPTYWPETPEAPGWPTETQRSLWSYNSLNKLREIDRHCLAWSEHHGQLLCRLAPLK